LSIDFKTWFVCFQSSITALRENPFLSFWHKNWGHFSIYFQTYLPINLPDAGGNHLNFPISSYVTSKPAATMQSLLFTLLFDVLALASGDFASGKSPNCPEASACIERVRKSVADDARFWFGEQWRRNCGARHRDPVHCSNPTALQKFTSLGGRLFHVKFYHPNYLSNLKVFPRITYAVSPGTGQSLYKALSLSPSHRVSLCKDIRVYLVLRLVRR
jgi:hypothetical protein